MADRLDKGLSRRSFLKKSAAGAAAAGLAATVPGLALAADDGIPGHLALDEIRPTASEPLVVYIQDAARGEIVLMTGTRQVVRNDPRLVSQLVRCCEV